jgi:coenzyme F420-0:L-glutamate ligase/coenzyme F420-1:gamma-L-glutamate ligase
MVKAVSVIGLESLPMVKKGDNLAELIVAALEREKVPLANGDVIVVAHKVVSKAEGRIVRLSDVKPTSKAVEIGVTRKDHRLVELILQETRRILKAASEILVVENKQGLICVNAGVDKSNVEGEDAYALLPVSSDESARRIRSQIVKMTGKDVAVIIVDTFSRPFRRGQVNFAIGLAGMDPFRDYRGQRDLFDYVLEVKNTAIADEIASAADLVMGQGKEGVPVAIVKGLHGVSWKADASVSDLFISEDEDLFRKAL